MPVVKGAIWKVSNTDFGLQISKYVTRVKAITGTFITGIIQILFHFSDFTFILYSNFEAFINLGSMVQGSLLDFTLFTTF